MNLELSGHGMMEEGQTGDKVPPPTSFRTQAEAMLPGSRLCSPVYTPTTVMKLASVLRKTSLGGQRRYNTVTEAIRTSAHSPAPKLVAEAVLYRELIALERQNTVCLHHPHSAGDSETKASDRWGVNRDPKRRA